MQITSTQLAQQKTINAEGVVHAITPPKMLILLLLQSFTCLSSIKCLSAATFGSDLTPTTERPPPLQSAGLQQRTTPLKQTTLKQTTLALKTTENRRGRLEIVRASVFAGGVHGVRDCLALACRTARRTVLRRPRTWIC